jgi:phage major head subunit gpT-like protein
MASKPDAFQGDINSYTNPGKHIHTSAVKIARPKKIKKQAPKLLHRERTARGKVLKTNRKKGLTEKGLQP